MRCGAGSLQTEPTSQPTCSASPPTPVRDLGENEAFCWGTWCPQEPAACTAPSSVHPHPGTGLPWPCLGLHAPAAHAATLTAKCAVPVPKPWLCGVREAMPTSVPPHRFVAGNVIFRGCNPFRYIPACARSSMPVPVHTHVYHNTPAAPSMLYPLCV